MNMDRERREKVDDYIASLSNELEESIKNVTDPPIQKAGLGGPQEPSGQAGGAGERVRPEKGRA